MSELDDKLQQLEIETWDRMQKAKSGNGELSALRDLTDEVRRLTVEACANIASKSAKMWWQNPGPASKMIANEIDGVRNQIRALLPQEDKHE